MNTTTRPGFEWWDRLGALPKYSFLLSFAGNAVRRVEDTVGNWVEYSAAQAVVDGAQTEINTLRQILCECAAALGNGSGMAPTCSLDFMALLPDEIRAEVAPTSRASGALPAEIRAGFDKWYDAFEFRREYDKYGPVEAAFTVWQAALASPQVAPAPEPAFYIHRKIIDQATGKVAASVKNALTWSEKPVYGWTIPVYLAAPVQVAPSAAVITADEINGKPPTAQSILEAMVDIQEDYERNAPEHRCYVDSAQREIFETARRFVAAPAPVAPTVSNARLQEIGEMREMLGNIAARVLSEPRPLEFCRKIDAELAALAGVAPAAPTPAQPSPVQIADDDQTMRAAIQGWLAFEHVSLVPGKCVSLQTSAPVTYAGLVCIYEAGMQRQQFATLPSEPEGEAP